MYPIQPEQIAYQQMIDFIPFEDRNHLEAKLRNSELSSFFLESVRKADLEVLFSYPDFRMQSLFHLKKDLLSKEDFTTIFIFHSVIDSGQKWERISLFENEGEISEKARTIVENRLLQDRTEEEKALFLEKMKKHSFIQHSFFSLEEERVIFSFSMMQEYLQLLPYPVGLYPILGNCSPRDALELRIRNYQDLRFFFPGLSFNPSFNPQDGEIDDWISHVFDTAISHSYIPKHHRLIWCHFAENLRLIECDEEEREQLFSLYKDLIQKKISHYHKNSIHSTRFFWDATDDFWKDWLIEHVVDDSLKEEVVKSLKKALDETATEFFPQIFHSLKERKESGEDLISLRLLDLLSS